MQEINSSTLICLFTLVQSLGWACGLLARFSTHSRHQALCQALFMLSLVIVGISTSLSLFLGSKCWLISATTLCSMVLLAICDFDRHRRPATI
jgi:hypothetical protein